MLKNNRHNRFNYHGLDIEIDPKTDPAIAYLIYRQRYELPEASMIQTYLKAGDHVVELGASSGLISALIQQAIGPSGQHLAVEANPDLIHRNTSNRAKVVSKAISYTKEAFVNFLGSVDTLGNRIAEDGDVRVEVITLSALLEGSSLVDPVLVCDIEGAEADLIAQDSKALHLCKSIIMAVHPTLADNELYDEKKFLSDLQKVGFSIKNRISNVVYLERFA